jgi:hypothetical protein
MQLPDEVVAFLGAVPADPFSPLAPEAAARATDELRRAYPLAKELGLVVLNDSGDSDVYCYVTRGPAAGAVLLVPHDDGLSFAFSSLTALDAALRAAAAAGTAIYELAPGTPAPAADQAGVREAVRAALADDGEDEANFLGVYLPLLAPDDVETLRLAVESRDFLVREVAAGFMAAAPRAAQVPLLEALCRDTYGQVWRPARRALAALNVAGPPYTEDQAYEVDTGERGPTGLAISLVERPDGKCWLVMDDVRRAGVAPPFHWTTDGYFSKDRFDLSKLLEMETDHKELADLGLAIIARLGLQHRTGGKHRG